MESNRSCGVLLHPTSLPGGHGIGDFGEGARRFVGYLQAARQSRWQILPLGPVNGSGSPYQALSSFAGNPLMISLDDLVAAGLLAPEDLNGAPGGNPAYCDFGAARAFKMPVLRRAFANFNALVAAAAAAAAAKEEATKEAAPKPSRRKTGRQAAKDAKEAAPKAKEAPKEEAEKEVKAAAPETPAPEGPRAPYDDRAFQAFRKEQAHWLGDFALFMALRENFDEAAWWQWPEKGLVRREAKALKEWREKLRDDVAFQEWAQFVFYVQWGALKKLANDAGIKIIGDIPIYPAHDSADVWAAPQFFAVDGDTGEASVMAGCPPDYFSPDGQLWGNPVYRWDKLRADNYQWWRRRLETTLKLVDVLRLDHFRGFESYWAVPAGETTARNGKWEKGPGGDFFKAMKKALGDLPLIAEDLGVITPEVEALRDGNGFPGMKILQFAFCDGANFYRPHTYAPNCVVYTGTHDNDTTRGWYAAWGDDYAHMGRDVIDRERDFARRYLAVDGNNIHWDMIRLAIASPADTAIYPMQDILGLGNDCRFNRPGVPTGNWTWRLTWEQLDHAEVNYLRDMTEIFDRAGNYR